MAKAQAESTTKRTTSKAAAEGSAPAAEKPVKEGSPDGKAAPRPRKWNYGIVPEHKVQAAKRTEEEGEPKLKAGEAEGYALAQKGCTVEQFLANSDRGILRRLSRKGLVNVIGTDGTVYPTDYVAPEKPAPKAKGQEAGDEKAA